MFAKFRTLNVMKIRLSVLVLFHAYGQKDTQPGGKGRVANAPKIEIKPKILTEK
jgi:hypothetical protein